MDLSQAFGSSVTDFISEEDIRLTYVVVDDAVRLVLGQGRGALMANIDIEGAFRNVPVRPEQWHLLGFQWSAQIFHVIVLAFERRSAPHLFNELLVCLSGFSKNALGTQAPSTIWTIFSLRRGEQRSLRASIKTMYFSWWIFWRSTKATRGHRAGHYFGVSRRRIGQQKIHAVGFPGALGPSIRTFGTVSHKKQLHEAKTAEPNWFLQF